MIVGKLVESAAQDDPAIAGRERPAEAWIPRGGICPLPARATSRKFGPLKAFAKYEQPPDLHWDDEKYQGDAYGAYGWAVYVAEVSVDMRTAEVRVEDFVAVQEVGKVINPVLAAGQIEGGVAQGHRLRALRKCRVAARPHDQRPDDQLHHAHFDGRPAHSRLLRGSSLRARPRRRQRNRRAAARRHRARDRECDRARHGNRHPAKFRSRPKC